MNESVKVEREKRERVCMLLDERTKFVKSGLDYVDGCCEALTLGCSLGCVLG